MIFNAYANTSKPYMGILPVSCGHIFAQYGREIKRPFGREDWLLFFCAQGQETFSLPSGEQVMESGGFVIYAPGEPQVHITTSKTKAEYYYMHFKTEEPLLSALGLQTSRIYNAQPSSEVGFVFEKILSEMQLKQEGYERFCVCYFLEILSLLCRNHNGRKAQKIAYFDRISYAVQIISREYAQDRSVEEYAAMVSLSKSHFSHLFSKITGIGPIAYRNRLRLENAKELLRDTAQTVDQIARGVGFDSVSYFYRAFQKYVGMSPTEYRNQKEVTANASLCCENEKRAARVSGDRL